jgi:hypothetical protein
VISSNSPCVIPNIHDMKDHNTTIILSEVQFKTLLYKKKKKCKIKKREYPFESKSYVCMHTLV